MNAVNLIPREHRDRRFAVSMSPLTIALLAGLGAVLVAVVLYVSAANSVTSRQNELARLTARTAQAQALSNSLTGNVTAVQQLSSQVANVRQLAGGRYPWPRLLDQIGQLMPVGTGLTSLQAGAASGAVSTVSTASTANTAGSGTETGASAPSSLQLSGCAASQSTVAKTMERLHGVTGVSDVQLASSTENSTSGSSSGANTAGTGSGGCAYPVQFQMSLIFGNAAGAGATGTPTTGATP
jgi:Tfp pilus assembly protein PilN